MLFIQNITELYKNTLVSQFGCGPEWAGGEGPTTSAGEGGADGWEGNEVDFDAMEARMKSMKENLARSEAWEWDADGGEWVDFDAAYNVSAENGVDMNIAYPVPKYMDDNSDTGWDNSGDPWETSPGDPWVGSSSGGWSSF
jgi:hypothetical protein